MTASWSITPGRCPSLPYPSAHSQMKCQSQPGGGALTHSKEDVAGGIEARGIDAGRIGWPAVTEDAASIAGDGALC